MPSKVVLLLVALAVQAFPATSQKRSDFDPVAFLLGEWKPASGSSAKVSAKAPETVFHPALEGQVIVREIRSGKKAADASRHDLLVIYRDDEANGLRALYFDEDGHTIQYTVAATGMNEITFLSQDSFGKPRYRLSYRLDSKENLLGELDVAAPNNATFKTHQRWTARRVEERREGWL